MNGNASAGLALLVADGAKSVEDVEIVRCGREKLAIDSLGKLQTPGVVVLDAGLDRQTGRRIRWRGGGPVARRPRPSHRRRDAGEQASHRGIRAYPSKSCACPARTHQLTASLVMTSLVARSQNSGLYPISLSFHLKAFPSLAFL